MDQLTIFEVINEFDDSKCNWIDILEEFEICTVLAVIPAEGFSPLENPYKYGSDEYEKAKKYGVIIRMLFSVKLALVKKRGKLLAIDLEITEKTTSLV